MTPEEVMRTVRELRTQGYLEFTDEEMAAEQTPRLTTSGENALVGLFLAAPDATVVSMLLVRGIGAAGVARGLREAGYGPGEVGRRLRGAMSEEESPR